MNRDGRAPFDPFELHLSVRTLIDRYAPGSLALADVRRTARWFGGQVNAMFGMRVAIRSRHPAPLVVATLDDDSADKRFSYTGLFGTARFGDVNAAKLRESARLMIEVVFRDGVSHKDLAP